jgi:hypothetical protein
VVNSKRSEHNVKRGAWSPEALICLHPTETSSEARETSSAPLRCRTASQVERKSSHIGSAAVSNSDTTQRWEHNVGRRDIGDRGVCLISSRRVRLQSEHVIDCGKVCSATVEDHVMLWTNPQRQAVVRMTDDR